MNLENLFALLKQYGPVMLDAIQNRGYDPGIIGEDIQDNIDISNFFNRALNENDNDFLGTLIQQDDDLLKDRLRKSDFLDFAGYPTTNIGNYEYSPSEIRHKVSKTPGRDLSTTYRYLKQMNKRNMFDE